MIVNDSKKPRSQNFSADKDIITNEISLYTNKTYKTIVTGKSEMNKASKYKINKDTCCT